MTGTAVEPFEVIFTGRTALAAATPERGINAASAAVLAQTAIGVLRQHLATQVSLNAFVSHMARRPTSP